jgi:hypothetical protein
LLVQSYAEPAARAIGTTTQHGGENTCASIGQSIATDRVAGRGSGGAQRRQPENDISAPDLRRLQVLDDSPASPPLGI